MNRHTMSLIDILYPPVNQWLKDVSKCKANRPLGVRVVRFSDDDEGIDERVAKPRRKATLDQH